MSLGSDDDTSSRTEERPRLLRSAGWFVVTFVCVTLFSMNGIVGGAPVGDALGFAFALMGVLATHEAAHYVVARRHGFSLEPPVFLPFPFAFGTLGAVIRLRTPPRDRVALLEMGVAGPLAGAVVAFTVLAVTLPLTGPDIAVPVGTEVLVFHDPLVVTLIGTLVAGGPPGRFAVLHPAALGAWVGCMLTGINLLPIGQLDGGHVLNALVPRAARAASIAGVAALLVAGWWWTGWYVWAGMLALLGGWKPLPVPDGGTLPVRTRVLAAIALAVFALTFMPVPVSVEQVAP